MSHPKLIFQYKVILLLPYWQMQVWSPDDLDSGQPDLQSLSVCCVHSLDGILALGYYCHTLSLADH